MADYTAVERFDETEVSYSTRSPVDSPTFVRRIVINQNRYIMRGRHAIHGWVTWVVYGAPDSTGAYSPYPGALTNITYSLPLYGAG